MTIAFDTIPSGILTPITLFEIKAGASPAVNPARILIVGEQDRAVATAADNTPYILDDRGVETLFGRGSMVSAMYRHARSISKLGAIYGISQQSSGTAAAGTLVFANPNGKTGMASIRIGENLIQVKLGKNDTAATFATKMKREINGNGYSPLQAFVTSDPATLDLRCRWHGASGNSIKVDNRWWGKDPDLSGKITISNIVGGTGGIVMDDILAGLGDNAFDIIITGVKDDTSLQSLGDFLNADTGRWSPLNQLFGHAIVGYADTFADLVTLGGNYNDPNLTILGHPGSLTPEWCWGAEYGALVQLHYSAPPEVSRPIKTLLLPGIEPAYKDDLWFTIDERQQHLAAGIATVMVSADRKVAMERDVTTYKTNDNSDLDPTWRDTNTRFQAKYFVQYMKSLIDLTYPRCALTDVDSGITGFVSPGQIRDTIIHGYIDLEAQGLVENVKLFADNLIVERNALDTNRVDVKMPPDVVNKLLVLACLVEVNLELTDNSFHPAAS